MMRAFSMIPTSWAHIVASAPTSSAENSTPRRLTRIRLSAKGRRYVAKRRVTKALLVVRDIDATGNAVRTTQTVRIGH